MERINLPEDVLKNAGHDDTFEKDAEEELRVHEIIGDVKTPELIDEADKTLGFIYEKLGREKDRLTEIKDSLIKAISQYNSFLSICAARENSPEDKELSRILERAAEEIKSDIQKMGEVKKSLEEKIYELTLKVDSIHSNKN